MKSYIIPSVQIRIHIESQQKLEGNTVQFSRSNHAILHAGRMPLGWFVSRVENSPDRQTGPSNAPWASYHPNTRQCTLDSKKGLGKQVSLVIFVRTLLSCFQIPRMGKGVRTGLLPDSWPK